MEKKVMEKIISIKSLKEISFTWDKLTDEDFLGINGENPSVEKMNVKTTFKDFFNLQKKFPNLKSIDIDYLDERFIKSNDKNGLEIGIIPDSKSKIEDIVIVKGNKCYCQPFEQLKSIEIKLIGITKGVDNFPIFNKNCKTILSSLISFHFWERDELEGPKYLCLLAKNINYMPNLKDNKLLIYYDYETFGEKEFNQFIKNILSMKFIKTINIKLRADSQYFEYPLVLLKEKFPDINFNKFEKVFIMRCKIPQNISSSKAKKISKDKNKILSKPNCNIY